MARLLRGLISDVEARIAGNPPRVLDYVESHARVFRLFDSKLLESFSQYHTEWTKILLFLKSQQVQYQSHQQHFERCEISWYFVGQSLELTDRKDQRCLYAGCLTGTLHNTSFRVCAGCHAAFYCSHRCQKA
jgi:hypothetical protein